MEDKTPNTKSTPHMQQSLNTSLVSDSKTYIEKPGKNQPHESSNANLM